jgi:hypothetical protein
VIWDESEYEEIEEWDDSADEMSLASDLHSACPGCGEANVLHDGEDNFNGESPDVDWIVWNPALAYRRVA